MAITIVPITFDPAGYARGADYNFLSTYDLISLNKDVDPDIANIYGDQLMTLTDFFGIKKAVDKGLSFVHFEDTHLMPKVKATVAAAAAGAAATFTFASTTPTQALAVSQYAPYLTAGTAEDTAVPLRVGDIIIVAYEPYYVSAVTTTTFTAYPLDVTVATSVNATAFEIPIPTNLYGEGSNQAAALASFTKKYTNNLHNVKHTKSWNDILQNIQLVVEGTRNYVIRDEEIGQRQMNNYCDGALLTSKSLTNTAVQNLAPNAPKMSTSGLISEAQSGYVQTYTSGTYAMDDIENLSLNLDLRKGGDAFMLLLGMQINATMDRGFMTTLQNGAISYGFFSDQQKKMIDLNFHGIRFGNMSFWKKKLNWFSDPQGGAASGLNYMEKGIAVPMSATSDEEGMTSSRIRKRFLKNMEMIVTPRDLKKIGDNGAAKFEVAYDAYVGLETFGKEQFAWLTV